MQNVEVHDGILAACIAQSSTNFVVAYETGQVRKFNSSSAREVVCLDLPLKDKYSAVCMSFNANAERIAIGCSDNRVRIFNVEELMEPPVVMRGIQVRCITWSADGMYIATGGGDGAARVMGSRKGSQVASFEGHHDDVVAVALSANGTFLATGCKDRHMRLFNLELKCQIACCFWDRCYALAFSHDNKYLAVGCDDNIMRLYDVNQLCLVYEAVVFEDYVRALAFNQGTVSVPHVRFTYVLP